MKRSKTLPDRVQHYGLFLTPLSDGLDINSYFDYEEKGTTYNVCTNLLLGTSLIVWVIYI